MQVTLTRQVARTISSKMQFQPLIFNDRLKDGTRSLKVWGWGRSEYRLAKRRLERLGCKVKMIDQEKTSPFGGRFYSVCRLHVKE